MNIKRDQLKSYFRKKAIPTELQFAELIDGTLNQADDGLVKKAGEALGIEAVGDDVSMKKVLRFFYDEAAQTAEAPDFTIGLRAYADKNDLQSGRRGLSITAGDNESSIFVDYDTGKVGIGTVNPQAALHIVGDARIDGTLTLPTATWTPIELLAASTMLGLEADLQPPASFKDPSGIVRLRGVMKTVGTAVAHNLPASTPFAKLAQGFCPASPVTVHMRILTVALAVTTPFVHKVVIDTDGNISPEAAISYSRYLFLDGLSFEAATS